MQDVTQWVAARFGPDVQPWIDELPALAGRLAARWGLELGDAFAGGASAVVWRCASPDGARVVLKLGPDRTLVGEEVAMLGHFAGSGRVPAVLFADPGSGAIVLEEIVPGTDGERLPEASLPDHWGGLLTALHATPVPRAPVRDLRGRCEEFFDRIGRRLSEPAIGSHIDEATWQRALRRCRSLLDTQTRTVLLHGDLHLGNVLDGGVTRGLVAIDPKACVGDPCFDAVDCVVAGAGREGIATRCERIAAACGLDGERLHAWSQVIAPVTAVSALSHDGRGPVVDELLALAR